MISIVTAYYNRKKLFLNTLKSIRAQNTSALIEVIAVDDGSDNDERLEDLVQEFPFLKIIRLEKENKWYHNSCIPFNIGFRAAKGDKIIIQNPECLHYGSILDYTEKNLATNDYLSFACFSLDKPSTENVESIYNERTVAQIIARNDHVVVEDGDAGWYNHSKHRPKAYHFCTAISKKDLISLGGFDELFALGIAYDDDEFLSRIKKKNLNIKFIDDELVLHQNHYSPQSGSFENRKHKMHLMVRNERLLKKLIDKPYYKANRISRYLPLRPKKYYIKAVLNIIERV